MSKRDSFGDINLTAELNAAPAVRIQGREGEMHPKRIAEYPKAFVVILDAGDEILSLLKHFAQTEHLAGSSFKAIGATGGLEIS